MIVLLNFDEIPDNQPIICYGSTVGFSIIVSGDILKKLFSAKNEAREKMEILNNFIAVILFSTVGVTRIVRYNSTYSTGQLIQEHLGIELSDFSKGEILQSNHNIFSCCFKELESTLLLVSWPSPLG